MYQRCAISFNYYSTGACELLFMFLSKIYTHRMCTMSPGIQCRVSAIKLLLGLFLLALSMPMLCRGQAERSTLGAPLSISTGFTYSEAKSDYFGGDSYFNTFGAYTDLDFPEPHRLFGLEGEWHSMMVPEDSTQNSFLASPRFGLRFNRFVPYMRVGAGIGRFDKPTTPYPQQNGTHFIVGAGGGMDIYLNRYFSVRGIDYEHQQWSFYPHSLSPSLISVGLSLHLR